jgi:hypothetical protein
MLCCLQVKKLTTDMPSILEALRGMGREVGGGGGGGDIEYTVVGSGFSMEGG